MKNRELKEFFLNNAEKDDFILNVKLKKDSFSDIFDFVPEGKITNNKIITPVAIVMPC